MRSSDVIDPLFVPKWAMGLTRYVRATPLVGPWGVDFDMKSGALSVPCRVTWGALRSLHGSPPREQDLLAVLEHNRDAIEATASALHDAGHAKFLTVHPRHMTKRWWQWQRRLKTVKERATSLARRSA